MMKQHGPNKPVVVLTGCDGNAFGVIGACLKAARRANWDKAAIGALSADFKSGNYDHLLGVAQHNFEVE
jgi:hypothetical protein